MNSNNTEKKEKATLWNINDKERHALDCFVNHHRCFITKLREILLRGTPTAICRYSLYVYHTGIGDDYKVQCNNCNTEFDITDYKSW